MNTFTLSHHRIHSKSLPAIHFSRALHVKSTAKQCPSGWLYFSLPDVRPTMTTPAVKGDDDDDRVEFAGTNTIRIKWSVAQRTFKEGAGTRISFPFIDEKDVKDSELLKAVLELTPYAAGFGKKEEEWAKVAAQLQTAVSSTGLPVFGTSISGKMCKDRFKNLMDAAKARQANAPFNSGGDDESVDEFVVLLEDSFERFSGFADVKKAATAKATSAVKSDREGAEALRRSSMGEMTRDELLALGGKADRKPSGSRSTTPVPPSGIHQRHFTDEMHESRKRRHEKDMATIEAKRERSRRKDELEERKLQADREDKQAERDDRARTMQLLQQLMGDVKKAAEEKK
jgi:hypothetical protein